MLVSGPAQVLTADSDPIFPAGHFNFGYIDSDAYTGSITYAPVDSSGGFWSWTSPGYTIGSGNFTPTKVTGIADTGTSLFLLPSSLVEAYYNVVSGAKYDNSQGGYTLPCSSAAPGFSFGVNDANILITVPGEYIKYAPVTSSGRTCYGGLQSDSGIGFSIFGDVALKAAFVVFDGGKQQLGWAPKKLNLTSG